MTMNTLVGKSFPSVPALPRRFFFHLLRALLRTRREIHRLSAQARRDRLQLGYRHLPQRVWNRHSALFIDR